MSTNMPISQKFNFGPILTPKMAPKCPKKSKFWKMVLDIGNKVENRYKSSTNTPMFGQFKFFANFD